MKFRLTLIGGYARPRATAGAESLRLRPLLRAEIGAFQNDVSRALEELNVSRSVCRFELCLELVDLSTQSALVAQLRRFAVYRPRKATLLSVAQVDWPRFARSPSQGRRDLLDMAILEAALLVKTASRVPADFDEERFASFFRGFSSARAAREVSRRHSLADGN